MHGEDKTAAAPLLPVDNRRPHKCQAVRNLVASWAPRISDFLKQPPGCAVARCDSGVTPHDNDIAVLAIHHYELPRATPIVKRENADLFVVIAKTEIHLERATASDGGHGRDARQFTS